MWLIAAWCHHPPAPGLKHGCLSLALWGSAVGSGGWGGGRLAWQGVIHHVQLCCSLEESLAWWCYQGILAKLWSNPASMLPSCSLCWLTPCLYFETFTTECISLSASIVFIKELWKVCLLHVFIHLFYRKYLYEKNKNWIYILLFLEEEENKHHKFCKVNLLAFGGIWS